MFKFTVGLQQSKEIECKLRIKTQPNNGRKAKTQTKSDHLYKLSKHKKNKHFVIQTNLNTVNKCLTFKILFKLIKWLSRMQEVEKIHENKPGLSCAKLSSGWCQLSQLQPCNANLIHFMGGCHYYIYNSRFLKFCLIWI